jgi:hypothetical protein
MLCIADTHFHPLLAIFHPKARNIHFHPFKAIQYPMAGMRLSSQKTIRLAVQQAMEKGKIAKVGGVCPRAALL